MRVAFVGTSHVHTIDYLTACRTLPWVDVVGICCPEADTYMRLPELPRVFKKQEDLPDHDVAVVLTDVASHDAVCSALTASAVFIEKPLGLNYERSRAIALSLGRRNIRTETGFFLRHSDAFQTICKVAKDSRLGRLQKASLEFSHPGLLDGWLRHWPAHLSVDRMGGGAFVDLSIHLIDAADLLFRPITARSCSLDRATSSGLIYDPSFEVRGSAIFMSKELAPIHIKASAISPQIVLRFELSFEGGEVQLDGGAVTARYGNSDHHVLHDGPMPTPAEGFRAALEGFRNVSTQVAPASDVLVTSALSEEMRNLDGNLV